MAYPPNLQHPEPAHRRHAEIPSKKIRFDTPQALEIKLALEQRALLKDWEMNDALLYYLALGLACEHDSAKQARAESL